MPSAQAQDHDAQSAQFIAGAVSANTDERQGNDDSAGISKDIPATSMGVEEEEPKDRGQI